MIDTKRRFTFGTLTRSNRAEVAEAIREMFVGAGKRYALAHLHSELQPSLRTGQVMDEVKVNDWGLTAHDSYGLILLDALIDEGYDDTFRSAYVMIDWNRETIEFKQRNPNGSISHLILAREASDLEVYS